MRLQDKANALSQTIFLGGNVATFEMAGRMQLMILLKEGLSPDSKVLDIGCGCLRGGYWLIHFLRPDCYFGIEPNRTMLETGIKEFLEAGVMEEKTPHFDHGSAFDFSVFGREFDFFVARSIWTHASKEQICIMLNGFVQHAADGGIFMTSYKRPKLFKPDYKGAQWIGRSDVSETPGIVRHNFRWIKSECRTRGLVAEEITDKTYNFGGQIWIRIRRS